MAKIARVFQKIFASSASNNGVFGSAQDGTKVLSNNLATLMGKPAFLTGWLDAIIGASKFPPLEEFQSLNYINTTQLAYIFQEGISEWNTDTVYYIGSIVKKTGTFQLYGSITNDNTGNALTDVVNWQYLGDISTIANAPSCVGDTRKARMSITTASASGTFTADQVVVGTTLAGNIQKLSTYSQAINLATTGAGGMDTGSAPTSGYVSLYAIAKADGTRSILACNVTTSSATIYAGANMPTGYTYSALIGIVPTDGSTPGLMLAGLISGREYFAQSAVQIISGGVGKASLTSQSVSSGVPPGAVSCSGQLSAVADAATTTKVAADGTGTGVQVGTVCNGAVTNLSSTLNFRKLPLITAQTIYYLSVNTNAAIISLFIDSYEW